MNIAEFVELYINASEEVKYQISQVLEEALSQIEHQDLSFGISDTIQ